VNKLKAATLVTALLIFIVGVWAQNKSPLALKQTIPVPGLTKEGDFDHLTMISRASAYSWPEKITLSSKSWILARASWFIPSLMSKLRTPWSIGPI